MDEGSLKHSGPNARETSSFVFLPDMILMRCPNCPYITSALGGDDSHWW